MIKVLSVHKASCDTAFERGIGEGSDDLLGAESRHFWVVNFFASKSGMYEAKRNLGLITLLLLGS